MSPLGLGFDNCACCETDCTIFSDDFDRADSSSLGSDWSQVTGSSAIDTNQLLLSAADTIVSYTGTVPANRNFRFDLTAGAQGETARLIASYVSSTSYFALEFEFHDSPYYGVLRAVNRSSGVDTTKEEWACPLLPNTTVEVAVGVASTDSRPVVVVDGIEYPISGPTGCTVSSMGSAGFALATGDTASDVRFDNFILEEQTVDCPPPSGTPLDLDCDWLAAGVPDEWQWELPGYASGTVVCGAATCDDFFGGALICALINPCFTIVSGAYAINYKYLQVYDCGGGDTLASEVTVLHRSEPCGPKAYLESSARATVGFGDSSQWRRYFPKGFDLRAETSYVIPILNAGDAVCTNEMTGMDITISPLYA